MRSRQWQLWGAGRATARPGGSVVAGRARRAAAEHPWMDLRAAAARMHAAMGLLRDASLCCSTRGSARRRLQAEVPKCRCVRDVDAPCARSCRRGDAWEVAMQHAAPRWHSMAVL
jgi:hypothetical protein